MRMDLSETRDLPAMQTGRVVRGGDAYKSEQGSDYEPGVSAETVGSHAVFLGIVTLQPGARTRAHVHERHETALYLLSGTCELWSGPEPERQELVKPGAPQQCSWRVAMKLLRRKAWCFSRKWMNEFRR
jgi:uncharacterized RmlC-like cupin family protein